MTRLSQILFAATAIAAVPLTAFAQDPPADPPAGGDGTAVVPVEGGAMTTPGWPKSQIDRPLTVLKGKLDALADIYILHSSVTVLGMTSSATAEGLAVGAGYGITDKLEVGGSYAFALHDFEIKGLLTVYGAFALMHTDKLDIGASADLAINLAPDDATETIHAGLAVRYKVAPKFAVFTGTPSKIGGVTDLGLRPAGPLGQHLTLGLNDGAAKTFSLPVGFGMQATPELFAYLNTNLLSITLSDVPDGADRVTSIADFTPLTLGALYAVNKNIDAAVSFGFLDLQNAGDAYLITVGARYFN
jgi:hypothetical protein